jgi:VWFA-related protein
MCRSTWPRFGIRSEITFAIIALLVLIARPDSSAQQNPDTNILQTPQVVKFASPPTMGVAPARQADDPAGLIRIPVTVIDDAGRCVESLDARDFSLSLDGEDSSIAWFKQNRATGAALGVLVDISQGMEFRSFSGRIFSDLPFVQTAIKNIVDKLHANDDVFLASFARRFHMLGDFSSDHRVLSERLPMLKVTDQLDDFDASGIYESVMKGITVLSHAPKTCERRALLVFTNAYNDSSTHGPDDVIAKAQFAGVTIYNIIVPRFWHQTDQYSIDSEMRRIAAETGGLTFFAKIDRGIDGLNSSIEEIVAELDSQYLLGFAVPQWSTNVLPVELMLPHHPGMRVRAPRVVRFRPEDLFRQTSSPSKEILPE